MQPDVSQVVVMRMDADPPTQHAATLAGGQGDLLILSVDDAIPWTRGENVLLVTGDPGERNFLQAVYVQPNRRFHMLRRASPWRRFDTRDNERFPVELGVLLRSTSGWRVEATLRDISAGGVAIQLSIAPPEAHLVVDISVNGYHANLPIDVLSMSDAPTGSILHCRFAGLEPPQAAFLNTLLADLAERYLPNAA